MDPREQSAFFMAEALGEEHKNGITPTFLAFQNVAIKRHLDAIDEDLQKLRKELWTRNWNGVETHD